ncbi:hypothetical protein [Haloplasma contractile]|uniref:Membrane lipoprotein n=1 Tax=Haloplasma contractile SSD-17B TaxID=1033810 RepID=U2DRK3_9MOLU|nr:hypothetical protein [Haloplasma contractile]ERJ11207.1 membrane lipoprotein [Haloplasma contractile SSD-17B]
MKKFLSIFAIISLFLITGCMNDDGDLNDTQGNNEETPEDTGDESYDAGTYKVGTDLVAGEYYLVSNEDEEGKLKINECDESCSKVLVDKEFSNNYYVAVTEGHSITVEGAVMYSVNHKPNPGITYISSMTIEEGMYKVGTDIPEGSYMLDNIDQTGYFKILSGLGKDATIIDEGSINLNVSKHLAKGQYIIIEGSSMYYNMH